jgi:hypothetical protein
LNEKLAGKLIAAIIFGILLGSYIHSDYVRWGSRGEAAFLAHQTQRFDHYMATPQPMLQTVLVSTIVVVGALAIYEGIAFVLAAILSAASGGRTKQ